MSAVVALFLRVSVVCLAAIAAAWLLRRQSAARRHLAFAAGLAGALAVGPIAAIVPRWTPPVPAAITASFSPDDPAPLLPLEEAATATVRSPARWTWDQVIVPALAGGAILRAAWLCLMLARLRRQSRAAQPAEGDWADQLPEVAGLLGVRRQVSLRLSARSMSPATWGWRAPVILLPAGAVSWDSARVRMVLLHELAHIARADWPVQMLAEAATVAYWWHPLVWMLRARLRREGERACDDLVLHSGVPAAEYGTELVRLARSSRRQPPRAVAVAMAHPSSLEGRVTAMLDSSLDRRPLTRRASAVCCAMLLAALPPVSAFRLPSQAPPQSLVVQAFDPSGAVLPGVSIALASDASGSQSTTTEGSGRATFAEVADGEYTLTASVPGFRTLKGPLVVKSARDRQRSITLQVGELEETVSVSARRPTTPPPPSAVTEPLRVGGNIKAPRKLTHVGPEYPAAMRDAGLEAVVPIEALISRDGTVASVRIVSADVHPEFARAASDAVSQWKFSPTLLNGEAVEVRMSVSVRFLLQD